MLEAGEERDAALARAERLDADLAAAAQQREAVAQQQAAAAQRADALAAELQAARAELARLQARAAPPCHPLPHRLDTPCSTCRSFLLMASSGRPSGLASAATASAVTPGNICGRTSVMQTLTYEQHPRQDKTSLSRAGGAAQPGGRRRRGGGRAGDRAGGARGGGARAGGGARDAVRAGVRVDELGHKEAGAAMRRTLPTMASSHGFSKGQDAFPRRRLRGETGFRVPFTCLCEQVAELKQANYELGERLEAARAGGEQVEAAQADAERARGEAARAREEAAKV